MAVTPLDFVQLDPNVMRDNLLLELTAEHQSAGPAVFMAVLCMFGQAPCSSATVTCSVRRICKDSGLTERKLLAVLGSWKTYSDSGFQYEQTGGSLTLKWPAFARKHAKVISARENGALGWRKPNANPTETEPEPNANPTVTHGIPTHSHSHTHSHTNTPPLPPVASGPTDQPVTGVWRDDKLRDPVNVQMLIGVVTRIAHKPYNPKREEADMRRKLDDVLTRYPASEIQAKLLDWKAHYTNCKWQTIGENLDDYMLTGKGPIDWAAERAQREAATALPEGVPIYLREVT